MESLEGDTLSNQGEMAPSDERSETTRLCAPNSAVSTKPNYLNFTGNICAVIFLGILAYCCFKDGVSLFSFHPILMSLGWLVFMTSAVNAITPGDMATEWMPIRLRSARHWVLQLCGGVIILLGFLIILSNKIIHEKPHFSSLHAKFGLSSFVLMFGTMLGGLGALYSLKLKQFLAPIYTKLMHSSFGLVTYSLGIITIILALFSNWWIFGEILRYTSLILVLIITLFTILRPTLKVYFRLKERLQNIN